MKITYDRKVDAMYVYFKKGRLDKTIEIGKNFLADINKKGDILGLEILDASKYIADNKKKTKIFIGNKSFSLPSPVK